MPTLPENSDRYLEGEKSLEFKVIDEVIRVKDKEAPGGFREEKYQIKLTRRGPVISDDLKDLKTDKLMTLRFSMFEGMAQELGLRAVLYSKSLDDLKQSIGKITAICLNFTYADTQGNIGWQVSGKLPVRSDNSGLVPFVVKNSTDNWKGWIKADEMPQEFNPEKGWLGSCNHKTVDHNYPYYYSSHFSPSIFQSVYRNFAILVYKDELGEELASVMLDNWYYWQEKLLIKVLDGEFEWFDDVLTPNKETLDDLFYQAGLKTMEEFSQTMGNDPEKWLWGKIHKLEFVSMIRQKGFGKSLLGGGRTRIWRFRRNTVSRIL